MKKSKNERSPWVKVKKKTGPKKKAEKAFAEESKQELAESDKGSWFGQDPSSCPSLTSNEKLSERPSGASSLKIKAIESTSSKEYMSESDISLSDEEEESEASEATKYWSIVDINFGRFAGRFVFLLTVLAAFFPSVFYLPHFADRSFT